MRFQKEEIGPKTKIKKGVSRATLGAIKSTMKKCLQNLETNVQSKSILNQTWGQNKDPVMKN